MQNRNEMGAFREAAETFLESPNNLDSSKGLPSKVFDQIVDYVSKNSRDIFDIKEELCFSCRVFPLAAADLLGMTLLEGKRNFDEDFRQNLLLLYERLLLHVQGLDTFASSTEAEAVKSLQEVCCSLETIEQGSF